MNSPVQGIAAIDWARTFIGLTSFNRLRKPELIGKFICSLLYPDWNSIHSGKRFGFDLEGCHSLDQSIPVITVGITGHRWNKILKSEAARIGALLTSVFTAIDLAVVEEQRTLHFAHALTLRLVSGMAEGADQMAISSRPSGWLLGAILPFPRAQFLKDFEPKHATGGVDRRPEFLVALEQAEPIIEIPLMSNAVRGYELAGEALLKESDVIVAVWDGEAAAGPGGTEIIVKRAIYLGIPVVWISSNQDRTPTLLSATLRADQLFDAVPASADVVRRAIEPIVKAVATRTSSQLSEMRKL